jgi:hypothetical protein
MYVPNQLKEGFSSEKKGKENNLDSLWFLIIINTAFNLFSQKEINSSVYSSSIEWGQRKTSLLLINLTWVKNDRCTQCPHLEHCTHFTNTRDVQ